MNPLFSVGEVVILQSVDHPELNGECTVLEAVAPGKFSSDGGKNGGALFTYRTEVYVGKSAWWVESSLRKKHQPGEHSFTDLMASLKNPVSV
jgi:hypothetical protein